MVTRQWIAGRGIKSLPLLAGKPIRTIVGVTPRGRKETCTLEELATESRWVARWNSALQVKAGGFHHRLYQLGAALFLLGLLLCAECQGLSPSFFMLARGCQIIFAIPELSVVSCFIDGQEKGVDTART